jgi:protein-disulfide isomerase
MYQSGDFRGGLLRIAQSAGMTEAQFNACITDDAATKALAARVEKHMREDKIDSTPTFIVNGKNIGSGDMSLAQLDAAIAEASK